MTNDKLSKRNISPLKILAIGPLPPPVGGVSVSFKMFCSELETRQNIFLKVMNSSTIHQKNKFIISELNFLLELWRNIRCCDISKLYCSTSQLPTLGLLTLFICYIRKKPFILRKAAGLDYRELGFIKGSLCEFIIKGSDLFLVQTKQLLKICLNRGIEQTKWFPTTRPESAFIKRGYHCKRFIYVGHIRKSKGIEDLLLAAKILSKKASFTLYGPFFEGMNETIFYNYPNIHYRGILDPENVQKELSKYDAFIFPSRAKSEGYPGGILEALSVGLPVIATKVGGVPEMIDERIGILIPPGDIEALVDAVNRFTQNSVFYRNLCQNVIQSKKTFSLSYWIDWFLSESSRLKISKSL